MWVKVGDTVVINDDTWNGVATGSFTPPTTGWYDVDIRAYQGGGGVGPQGDWATAGIGLGIRQGAATLSPGDYQPFANGAAGISLAVDQTADTVFSNILLAGGANSSINADASGVTVSGVISSSAAEGLIKTGAETLTLTGANTYAGNTNVSAGSLVLGGTGQLKFYPQANGVTNKVTGSGSATFTGAFVIDLSGANTTAGNSWVLADISTSVFDTAFSVSGFSDPESDGTWVRNEGSNIWTFDEANATLSVAAAGGYDTWAAQISNSDDRDRADDPDSDGFTNIEEFLFGTSPIVPTASLVTTTTSGGNLVLRWLQRETGAAYALKESTTMELGSWTTSPIAPALDDQTGAATDYDRWIATIPLGSGSKFFRVEGTED